MPRSFISEDDIEKSILKKIKDEIQFIMITHRKGTMENACSLYGVTMEEKGISKVISLKMND